MDAAAEWKVAVPLMVNFLLQKLLKDPMILICKQWQKKFYFGLADLNHTKIIQGTLKKKAMRIATN